MVPCAYRGVKPCEVAGETLGGVILGVKDSDEGKGDMLLGV